MYKIIRFYSDGRRPRWVGRLKMPTLELAQLHCNSPLTQGELRGGVKWFDGYQKIKSK
jgi:hypothetical protein